jgi:hypothetical protein
MASPHVAGLAAVLMGSRMLAGAKTIGLKSTAVQDYIVSSSTNEELRRIQHDYRWLYSWLQRRCTQAVCLVV